VTLAALYDVLAYALFGPTCMCVSAVSVMVAAHVDCVYEERTQSQHIVMCLLLRAQREKCKALMRVEIYTKESPQCFPSQWASTVVLDAVLSIAIAAQPTFVGRGCNLLEAAGCAPAIPNGMQYCGTYAGWNKRSELLFFSLEWTRFATCAGGPASSIRAEMWSEGPGAFTSIHLLSF
jgi:hypothetical protein